MDLWFELQIDFEIFEVIWGVSDKISLPSQRSTRNYSPCQESKQQFSKSNVTPWMKIGVHDNYIGVPPPYLFKPGKSDADLVWTLHAWVVP